MVSTRQSSSNGASGPDCNPSSSSTCNAIDSTGIKTRHGGQSVVNVVNPSPDNPFAAGAVKIYTPTVQFLDLPMEIFAKIFSYTGYKTVSNLRLVCRQMDRIGGMILNSTFQKLQTQLLHRFQTIKAKMPRRESARRNHPLACESDIVETLHMRLTLLQMSFGKHIERKHCCFFAGEILDEVYRILHHVNVTPKLARPYRVTDELYDLSTMAMEYFKEHIEPRLPEIAYFGNEFFEFPGSLQSSSNNKSWMLESPPHSGMKAIEYDSPAPEGRLSESQNSTATSNIVLRKRMKKIRQSVKRCSTQLAIVKKELKTCKTKMSEQQKQFHDYMVRMDDYEKKNDETARKFSTLLQELNKCKTELQYWRSKSPLTSFCASCGKRNGVAPEDVLLMTAAANGSLVEGVDVAQQASTSATFHTPASFQTSFSVSSPPTMAVSPPHPSSSAVEMAVDAAGVAPTANVGDEYKARQVGATKRKSDASTPASYGVKRSKKPRAMLKVRQKRS
ncbi:Hypothetical protein NTJ_10794 [Nesidiocoris tenuis]|uniref:F-box domain-containing protein n=1 Tax=Nesidiocoris tenuis TaxID=355587 RepID=A0ABN7B468_9HEMI|nr:Hypothetical protein NTJ_10794 [Nesidiocoris tenuis]